MKSIYTLLIPMVLFNVCLFGQVSTETISVGERIVIHSKILNQERSILVRFPEAYKTSQVSYPVHYILDAELAFQYHSGVVAVKSVLRQIPDALVVAIVNIDRNFDLRTDQNADKFLSFITQELIPFIEKNYRTNKERLLAGYSLAGGFVIHALFTAPEYFDHFLAGSPGGLKRVVGNHLDTFPDQLKSKKTLYSSLGTADKRTDIEYFSSFCNHLTGIKSDGFIFHFDLNKNRHHFNNFLLTLEDGLDFTYKDWKSKK